MVRWPGKIPAGSTVHAPVIGSDLLPTVLALTGVDRKPLGSRTLDGTDVLPLLTSQSKAIPRIQPLFWRLDMAPNAKTALRVGNLKILADESRTQFEFYDLEADPRETTDLQTQRPADFQSFKALLISHNTAVESEGPDWFKRLNPSGARPRTEKSGAPKEAGQ
jgi:arylsulfatase A